MAAGAGRELYSPMRTCIRERANDPIVAVHEKYRCLAELGGLVVPRGTEFGPMGHHLPIRTGKDSVKLELVDVPAVKYLLGDFVEACGPLQLQVGYDR